MCVFSCVWIFVTHGLKPARLLCPWNFSRQEYWNGFPFPPPGDLPNKGLNPGLLCLLIGRQHTYTIGKNTVLPSSNKSSLVAQTGKNLPAVRETWVWSQGSEDPLEEGMATHSSILTWRIPIDSGAWRAIVHGVTTNQTWLRMHTHTHI